MANKANDTSNFGAADQVFELSEFELCSNDASTLSGRFPFRNVIHNIPLINSRGETIGREDLESYARSLLDTKFQVIHSSICEGTLYAYNISYAVGPKQGSPKFFEAEATLLASEGLAGHKQKKLHLVE